jgi:sugar/nucleoside kinase (ribokinase family)
MAHYVLVGTLTKDALPDGGYILGGTVFYSGVQARRLGADVTVITTAEPDINLSAIEAGTVVHIQESPESTTFENIYDEQGNRVQNVRAKASPLDPQKAPSLHTPPDILHLGPLIDEVPLDYNKVFPDAKLGITPQGWMRHIDEKGRVHPRIWAEAEQLLPQAWAVVFSEEDVGYDEREIQRLADLCPVTVCTRNISAATLFVNGKSSEVPVHPSNIVDPTGAGDVFAAAFFVWLHESGDPEKAVQFAHIAAGMSIEGVGVRSVPTREQVLNIFRGL